MTAAQKTTTVVTTTTSTTPRAKAKGKVQQNSILKPKKPTREECEKAYTTMTSILDLRRPDDLEVGKMIFQGLLD